MSSVISVEEAMAMLGLARYLLRIVDMRAGCSSKIISKIFRCVPEMVS